MELFVTSFEIENMVQTIKDVSEPLAAKNDNGFVLILMVPWGQCLRMKQNLDNV